VDAVGTFFLLGGMALSEIMSAPIAIGLLIVYLLLMIEVWQRMYFDGQAEDAVLEAALGETKRKPVIAMGGAENTKTDVICIR